MPSGIPSSLSSFKIEIDATHSDSPPIFPLVKSSNNTSSALCISSLLSNFSPSGWGVNGLACNEYYFNMREIVNLVLG